MLEQNNQYNILNRKIDTEVIRAFFNGTLEDDIDKIPYRIFPKHSAKVSKCCIFKERAMVRYRIMELLGINIDKYDFEYLPIKSYLEFALHEGVDDFPLLTTVQLACYGCPPEQYRISDACRGCAARPCTTNCPKDAIVFIGGRAHILEDKCVKCGRCFSVCPYHAILHLPVPCEEACPVGAVHKNEHGHAQVDHSKCISCGKCIHSCPFGAIAERSALLPILKMLKNKEKTVAMIAPAIEGQFPGTLSQIKSALLKVGFTQVVEVAAGAEETSINEARELQEKKREGHGYMTTSCCPAYTQLVEKHLKFLKPIISTALSPMGYTARMCREKFPDHKNIFIGPCLAKRVEGIRDQNVDGVMNFNELSSLFMALDIEVGEMEKSDLGEVGSFRDCRNFCFSEGVGVCVLNRVENRDEMKIMPINGLDRKKIAIMRTWEKKAPDADLVEVMCCEGGCIQGPSSITKTSLAMKYRGKD